jgi:hypothetical protein
LKNWRFIGQIDDILIVVAVGFFIAGKRKTGTATIGNRTVKRLATQPTTDGSLKDLSSGRTAAERLW